MRHLLVPSYRCAAGSNFGIVGSPRLIDDLDHAVPLVRPHPSKRDNRLRRTTPHVYTSCRQTGQRVVLTSGAAITHRLPSRRRTGRRKDFTSDLADWQAKLHGALAAKPDHARDPAGRGHPRIAASFLDRAHRRGPSLLLVTDDVDQHPDDGRRLAASSNRGRAVELVAADAALAWRETDGSSPQPPAVGRLLGRRYAHGRK